MIRLNGDPYNHKLRLTKVMGKGNPAKLHTKFIGVRLRKQTFEYITVDVGRSPSFRLSTLDAYVAMEPTVGVSDIVVRDHVLAAVPTTLTTRHGPI
jgi:hypothetical protein